MTKTTIDVVIYRDKNYPSSWIDEKAGYPDKIAKFLQERGFEVVNAEELRKFIVKSIEDEDSHRKLVVFAQDIIPDTIVEDVIDPSNTTLREFLDQGGSIL